MNSISPVFPSFPVHGNRATPFTTRPAKFSCRCSFFPLVTRVERTANPCLTFDDVDQHRVRHPRWRARHRPGLQRPASRQLQRPRSRRNGRRRYRVTLDGVCGFGAGGGGAACGVPAPGNCRFAIGDDCCCAVTTGGAITPGSPVRAGMFGRTTGGSNVFRAGSASSTGPPRWRAAALGSPRAARHPASSPRTPPSLLDPAALDSASSRASSSAADFTSACRTASFATT